MSMAYILGAYLLGAVPFGIFFSLAFGGPNPMTAGSKNIGFTNVLRTTGKAPAVLTLVFDMCKGGVFVFLLKDDPITVLSYLAGFSAVLGHNFSIYLGFKGGKGVATGFGALFSLSPLIGLGSVMIWLLVFYFSKISSLSALSSFFLQPVLCYFFASRELFLFSLSLSSLIFIRHHANIRRLVCGDELKLKKSA